MVVDAGVSRRSSQTLLFPVWYVLIGSGITIAFSKAEVDNVYEITPDTETHQKVFWLNISMNERTRVNIFDARNLTKRNSNAVTLISSQR